MKLTPLDIKKQNFSRSLRGYDSEEVQAFLSMLADQWEVTLDERRRLEERNRDLKNKIAHYENVEEALQEALHTARENKEQVLENARREAKMIVREAEAEADSIKRNTVEEHRQLKQEVAQISDRRGEIVARLRAFLMSEMELLARFEGDDPSGFIQLMAQEDQRQIGRSGASDPGAQVIGGETETSEVNQTGESYAPAQGEPTTTAEPRQGARERSPSSESPTAPPDFSERQHAEDTELDSDEVLHQVAAREEKQTASDEKPESNEPRQETPSRMRSEQAEAPTSAAVEGGRERADESSEPEKSPGWIVHSLFNAAEEGTDVDEERERREPRSAVERPSEVEEEDQVTASSEEIEKIRRILSDMDD